MIVVEGNARLIQKGEQVLAMTAQTLDQTSGLLVFPRRIDQQGQPLVQPVAARLALRAPIAVDRVLGHFRLNLRNVFDIELVNELIPQIDVAARLLRAAGLLNWGSCFFTSS